jgi:hypothetical protein
MQRRYAGMQRHVLNQRRRLFGAHKPGGAIAMNVTLGVFARDRAFADPA